MSSMPLYCKVMQELESQIANGDWKPGDKLPTEAELEQAYHVSNITIRRALKELVGRGLIRRVRGGGSYINDFGRHKANGEPTISDRVIGLLLPVNRDNGDMMDIVCGIGRCCFEHGYLLNVMNFSPTNGDEAEALEKLVAKSVGVLYYPVHLQRSFELLYTLNRRHYPLVTIDQKIADLDFPSVTSDNLAGTYEATRYLMKKGHRNICFLSVFNEATSVRDRFIGFCHAMEDGGNSVDSRHYCVRFPEESESSAETHDRILAQLLDRPDPVTAVLAVNDYVAYEMMLAAERRGVRIPEDMSIIGFDNLPFIEQMRLPLMTVSQDLYTIGEKAAQLLIDRVEGRVALSVTVPVRLINRASVAAIDHKEH